MAEQICSQCGHPAHCNTECPTCADQVAKNKRPSLCKPCECPSCL